MRKLFLSSQGLPLQVRQSFLDFLGRDPKGVKVAHIPTAANPYPKREWVDLSRKEMVDLGFNVTDVDLAVETPESLKQKLEAVDVIYVNGGNTFYLLDWVRKSGFDTLLPGLLDAGKIYFGLSAGSIIVGPNIESSGWDPNFDENTPGLTDLSGIGIVPFTVVPHYQNKDKEAVEKQARQVEYLTIALTDAQAVVVTGSSQEVVGEGDVVTFSAD